MRNYWLRIALGAAVIFTVGMIGITLARQGVSHVRHVVEGSGPISLPLAFIPFTLNGEKLGTVSRVVLERDAPKEISGVELEIKLRDSVIARGLEGCHLTANFDAEHHPDWSPGKVAATLTRRLYLSVGRRLRASFPRVRTGDFSAGECDRSSAAAK
jgi:hypothetical protein